MCRTETSVKIHLSNFKTTSCVSFFLLPRTFLLRRALGGLKTVGEAVSKATVGNLPRMSSAGHCVSVVLIETLRWVRTAVSVSATRQRRGRQPQLNTAVPLHYYWIYLVPYLLIEPLEQVPAGATAECRSFRLDGLLKSVTCVAHRILLPICTVNYRCLDTRNVPTRSSRRKKGTIRVS